MLRPIGARLLVKRIDAPKLTSSTIIIPETAEDEKSAFALVIAVGSKVTEAISVADTVLLSKYSGAPVTVELDGETLEADIVMQDDVLGVLKEN
jgi:chaperonin GroES